MTHQNRILSAADQSTTDTAVASVRNMQDLDDFVRFFELSLDLFCLANMEGYFLRINPNFSKVLGYSEADLLARPFLDFVHPDDHFATTNVMRQLENEGEVVRFRNRYRSVADRFHLFEWTAKVDAGIIYAVARDVTEQSNMEEVLFNNQHRECAILDHTPAVVYVKGIDHRYQLINQQFSDLFHLHLDTVIGKTDYALFPPKLAARFIANDDVVASSGEPLTVEELVPHDDGMHNYISVKFPLRDMRGEITAVAGISTDITDRIRVQAVEQELEMARVFQRTLYPQQAPEIPGIQIAGAVFPVSHVCGDYYDFIPLSDQRVAISLGDVAGHGYKQALQMVELRSSSRILLRKTGGLQQTVEELNDILCEDFQADPSFVSFFLAYFDVESHSFRYIGAGHDAFVFKADGHVIHLDSTGLVLGVRPGESYPEAGPYPLNAGDVFAVFTDGFNEAVDQHGAEFSKPSVIAALLEKRHESVRAMIDNLNHAVHAHVGQMVVQDDMTVVVVKVTD